MDISAIICLFFVCIVHVSPDLATGPIYGDDDLLKLFAPTHGEFVRLARYPPAQPNIPLSFNDNVDLSSSTSDARLLPISFGALKSCTAALYIDGALAYSKEVSTHCLLAALTTHRWLTPPS
jgi:hypothetical protein